MEWDKEPNLKELTETFNRYVDEIGCMDNEAGYCASHKITSRIKIEDDEDGIYEVTGLDISQLGGCGCWCDLIIKIKKVE